MPVMPISNLLKFLRYPYLITHLVAVLLIQVATSKMPVMSAESSTLLESKTAESTAALQLTQGRKYYEAGQFAEAAKTWEQAVKVFAAQGDKLNYAMVLSNLSLTYQQLGQWQQAQKAIAESFRLLGYSEQRSLRRAGVSPVEATGVGRGAEGQRGKGEISIQNLKVLAQALNTQGSLQLAQGQAEQALATWQQATTAYEQSGDRAGIIRSSINQAQALRALGLYRRALSTLLQLNEVLQKQPDSVIKAAGLRSLGTTLQLIGDLNQSRQVLQQSLAVAQKLKSSPDISAALLSLGNTARSQEDAKAAIAFYDRSAKTATDSTTSVQARLNKLSLLLNQQQWSDAEALQSKIQPDITNLPPSRTTVYAQINFAQSLMKLKSQELHIAKILSTAVGQAKSIGDKRAEAYALGNLGKIYEQTQQWSSAQELTQEALILAQAINASDITYNWQWQLGRLLKAQGDTTGAIAAYSEAVKTLQSLRSDLVSINPDVQFSFRESVEPVYRELVSLLLQPSGKALDQKNLVKAREVIDSLQLAELDNFFREACLDPQPVQLDTINEQAAVIYPIILADRLEVILSLPGQPLRHYATSLSQSQVEEIISQFRQTLVIRSKREFVPLAQKIYDWLIRPAEAHLTKSSVNTLVFVLDGALRNIPMAALHNRNQYLVEKYSIALAPSLQLIAPKPIHTKELKALTAGLSESRQGFAPLSNVPLELNRIHSEVASQVMLNQDFTSSAFQKQLKSSTFPIVHIATHGQFSSKAEQTFILSWDDRIDVNQLNNILQPSNNNLGAIELLVLSACQTAAGDKRAALGLAGIAVKAGARSTLATLWSVDDASTAQLMSQFYRELASTTVTKAEALRRAQLKLIKDPAQRHPIYWAPYVLVGNWL